MLTAKRGWVRGRENAKEFLTANPDLASEIELAVRQRSIDVDDLLKDKDKSGWSEDSPEDGLEPE